MCDKEKYIKIYQEINELQLQDTLQLISEASTPDEKDFFEVITNYLLQKRQREAIANNVF